MKVPALSLLLLGASPALPVTSIGDPVKEGLRLYGAGKYAEAAAAFRAALVADPDDARLNYNLALALWRAGDADGAETAAEKAAALADGAFDGLRDGLIGNLRYEAARALAAAGVEPSEEIPNLERALGLATTARTHFQSGALDLVQRTPGSGVELRRNLERAIHLEANLDARLDAAKQRQREQEQRQKKPDDKQGDEKPGDEKPGDEKPGDEKPGDEKPGDEKPGDEKPGDEKAEADKAGGKAGKADANPKNEKPEKPDQETLEQKNSDAKKAGEDVTDDASQSEPHQAGPAQRAPGEHDPTKDLTPEQKQQMLEKLREFEATLQKIRQARRAARPKVKKDW